MTSLAADLAAALRNSRVAPVTLERILTAPEYFALTVASPLQRAVCRIADGTPLGGQLADLEAVRRAVGDVTSLPSRPPAELLLLSGIRAGKSLLAAALAVRATQTCDVSKLSAGDEVRVSVLSLRIDLAHVIFSHIVGNVMARPALRSLLVSAPTADAVWLRHPSGRPIEIKVVAGARAGATLVARWSAGVIFDEAPRMIGVEDGVVNFDDARAAVLGRLLPGAQLVALGSPWAPFGPIYKMTQDSFGKPTEHLVVIRAPANEMNPAWWTPERVEELRQRDPDVYRTDILGEFAAADAGMFPLDQLEGATRKGPVELPPEAGAAYAAAMDPATRSNAWTFVIAKREWEPSRYVVALAKQWKPKQGAPLSPAAVLDEIAVLCREYGVEMVRTDGWSADAIADLARDRDLVVQDERITTPERVELYENLRTRLAQGELELPPVSELRSDLLSARKVVTQTGMTIHLPKTPDGRHADFAPSVVLAVAGLPGEARRPTIDRGAARRGARGGSGRGGGW